jgi:amino acid transporter
VQWYGEAEFWLSSGKVFLILIVFSFTFITMVGGNPKHNANGFLYWWKPGAFAEYIATGDLGRFEGFLACLWNAAFTIVGPEYVSMVSGETKLPRKYLKNAFKTTYARFAFFFIGSALCVGIVIPYNEPHLLAIISGKTGGSGTASASPYVIAMNNLGITGLPHVVNALLITSIFSAGNAYVYCGSRSLYGLAQEGQAPKFIRKCTPSGVPIYALGITMLFPFMAFLNVSGNAAQVLSWFTNIITAGGIIDYLVMSVTYIFFYRACKAQNIDRRSLPYYGYFQPYCGFVCACWFTTVVCVYGYTVFLPGFWSIKDFFTYYTMVIVAPCLFFGWKLVKRTKFIKPEEADLVWDRPAIDAYEAAWDDDGNDFWTEIAQMFGFRMSRRASVDAPLYTRESIRDSIRRPSVG